eukprot:GHRR01027407.1.p1 GENE.GHRR01027407.1~~GHRR01027407.1.p1  ORF type:complete len:239 (+),score=83.36 GHRR01027407.1:278-994(+)
MAMVDDATLQAEERESLAAIYADDFEHSSTENFCRVYLPSKAKGPVTVLQTFLPVSYPSAAGPVFEIEAPHVASHLLAAAVSEMEGMFSPGEVCLFTCIEWLREQLPQWQQPSTGLQSAEDAALAQALDTSLAVCSSSAGSEADDELHHLPKSTGRGISQPSSSYDSGSAVMEQMRSRIISGEPSTEHKSTFQAHIAPVTDVQQVRAVVAVLLENNKIRNATHNIMAYRIGALGKPGI